MPKINIPGVSAVLSTHTQHVQLKLGIGGVAEYKRYLVIANPKRREMGRKGRIRPKNECDLYVEIRSSSAYRTKILFCM